MKASQQVPILIQGSRRPRLARRLLVLALGIGAVPALAQKELLPPALPAATDTVRRVVDLPPAELDSLAAQPLVPTVDSVRLLWLQTPATLYETVGDRMGCLESDMPLHFNEAVLAYVRLFTERQRGYTQRVLEREQFYFPTFEKYLAQYNLPTDLKYLSVVESALIPTAKSPVGAVGLWQFMPPTASDLRLKRDEWVDERMQPDKATEAACKHLRYLYGVFHDWELVLAAYNWGAGNMQRVMRKTGKKTFWDLYPHLPAETRNYVPTFTAIMYAMKYAPEHSLNDPALRYQHYEPLDTLGLQGQALDLRRLSRALGYTDSLTVGRYNPEVRHGGLPAGYRPYVLRYPSAAREHLSGVDRATLLAYCQPISELPQLLPARPVYLTGMAPWPGAEALAASPHPDASSPARRYRKLYYTVRRGQTVATVAEKFDVSPAQVRRWNELPRHAATLKPGRELLVLLPLPAATEPTVAAIVPAAPHHPVPADSATQALAAANARYAREAQAIALREATQAKEVLRIQKMQAARVVAQQQQAIFRAAALAKAAAAEKRAQQLTVADAEPAPADTDAEPAVASAAATEAATAVPAIYHRKPKLLAAAPTPAAELPPPVPTTKPAVVAAAPSPKAETYVVRPGDNLTKLAREHNVSVAQVRDWNQLMGEGVVAGQRLRFGAAGPAVGPAPAHPAAHPEPQFSTHTVQPHDTLYSIARRFKVSVPELRRLNHLTTDDVKVGQKLVVQAG